MSFLTITILVLSVIQAAFSQARGPVTGTGTSGTGTKECPVTDSCDKDGCLTCSTIVTDPITLKRTATLSTTGCKSTQTISWACCRSGCTLETCSGSTVVGGKCDAYTADPGQLVVDVAPGATTITVQIHDGSFLGSTDCSGAGACCGGAGTSCSNAVSGVCTKTIDISTCTVIDPIDTGCDDDSDCTGDAGGPCAHYVCNNEGDCVLEYDVGTVCRASAGVCDVEERCDGIKADCPKDEKESTTKLCGVAIGVCDSAEYCDGLTNDCPQNDFVSKDTVCRDSAGDCDKVEKCLGDSPFCPDDDFKSDDVECRPIGGVCDLPENCPGDGPHCPKDAKKECTTECRESQGECDIAETCDGYSNDCPDDIKAGKEKTCGNFYGDCDVEDHCDGVANECPTDLVKAKGVTCRFHSNLCDIAEECDGESHECPPNHRFEQGYVYTCDDTVYYCGIKEEDIQKTDDSCFFADKKIGSGAICDNLVALGKGCLDECADLTCSGKVGKIVVGDCNDGLWETITEKFDPESEGFCWDEDLYD